MMQRVSFAQARHFQLRAVFQLHWPSFARLTVTAFAVLIKGGARSSKFVGRRGRRRFGINDRRSRALVAAGDKQNWKKGGDGEQHEQSTIHQRVLRIGHKVIFRESDASISRGVSILSAKLQPTKIKGRIGAPNSGLLIAARKYRRSFFDPGIGTMSSESDHTNNSTRGSLRLAPNVEELEEHKRKLPRQFVNFTFYRARPDWRMLSDDQKRACKQGFMKTVDDFRRDLLIRTYSTVGLRTSADFMIWRIGCDLEPMQEMTGRLNGTELAKYVEPTQSLLSMTKRSMYIEKNCSEQPEEIG